MTLLKALLYRNFELRKWSLLLYTMLLLFFPIYYLFFKSTFIIKIIISGLLVLIALLHSGQSFVTLSNLGKRGALTFYQSLPVSRRDLINANFLTTIILTLYAAVVLMLYNNYNVNLSFVTVNQVKVDGPMMFIFSNMVTLIFVFNKFGEEKTLSIPYILFIIIVNFILPLVALIVLFICERMLNWHFIHIPTVLWSAFILSIIAMVITYVVQIVRTK
ncbi:phenol-soluble modulin export ABC transporter permease subunit PmtB [Staphylococcus massiliensis]|uniref:phenol-soluble modulin export ABC transporter permease subunit PmtB n=1 Tax=Staphylococcus massiliensis TaxID=555791 RepID=UPI001EDD398C